MDDTQLVFLHLRISGKKDGHTLHHLNYPDLIFMMGTPNGTAIIQIISNHTKVGVSFCLCAGFPQKPKYTICFLADPIYMVLS